MSVITRTIIKSSLDASTDALKAAEEALASAKIANNHAKAAYDAFCFSGAACLQGEPSTESLNSDLKATENKPTDESTEEFFDAVEGEDEDISNSVEEEDPEFIVLSSPSAEILDVEKDDNHNVKISSEELTEVSALNSEDEKVYSFSRCLTKLPCARLHFGKVDKHRIILTVDRDIRKTSLLKKTNSQ